MIELTRTDVEGGYSLDLNMESKDSSRNPSTGELNYPSWTKTVYMYPFHRYTQTVRKDRDKGLLDNSSRRHIWKPFENYILKTASGTKVKMTYWDAQFGSAPNHTYYSTNPPPARMFYHYWTPLGGPSEYFGEDGKYNLPRTVNGAQVCTPFYVPQESGSFVTPPANIGKLQQLALSYMLPSIKEELSAINSLYELKDFAPLLKGAVDLVKTRSLANLIKVGLKQLKATNGKSLPSTARELLRYSSGGFLNWKFAIAPLISDIGAIHRSLSTYKKHINALVSKTGGRQTRHFTLRFDEFNNSEDTVLGNFPAPWVAQNGTADYKCRRLIKYEQTTFHAQVQFNYNYTAYQRQHAAALAQLDSLGINFNPRIIWDALPFSFVVDWVLKVGDSLDQFKIRNMEPQINIHQYLWSVKRKRKIECFISPRDDHPQPEPSLILSEVSLPLVEEEVYGRFTDYPVVPSLIETSGLNSNEFTLGAAIVISQSSRR